ncbi:MAG: F0F1 ATP synthase subunit delta [Patescibacteria group bacterium]|jgi:F0F1-type ATP synthase delta subunit
MTTSTHYAKALLDAYEQATSENSAGKMLDHFVSFIKQHRLAPLVPAILSAVLREVELRQYRKSSVIQVAHATPESTFKMFENSVITENKNLIGGFTVKQEDRAIDASVSGALEQLRMVMKSV